MLEITVRQRCFRVLQTISLQRVDSQLESIHLFNQKKGSTIKRKREPRNATEIDSARANRRVQTKGQQFVSIRA
jgi:hypothetical protein